MFDLTRGALAPYGVDAKVRVGFLDAFAVAPNHPFAVPENPRVAQSHQKVRVPTHMQAPGLVHA